MIAVVADVHASLGRMLEIEDLLPESYKLSHIFAKEREGGIGADNVCLL